MAYFGEGVKVGGGATILPAAAGVVTIISNVLTMCGGSSGWALANSSGTSLLSSDASGNITAFPNSNVNLDISLTPASTSVSYRRAINWGVGGADTALPTAGTASAGEKLVFYRDTSNIEIKTGLGDLTNAAGISHYIGGNTVLSTNIAFAVYTAASKTTYSPIISATVAGAWAFPKNTEHLFGSTGGGNANTVLGLDTASTSYSSFIRLSQGGAGEAYIGSVYAGHLLSDSAATDLCITANGGSIRLGQVSGASQAVCSPAGAWTWGPDGNTSLSHTLHGKELNLKKRGAINFFNGDNSNSGWIRSNATTIYGDIEFAPGGTVTGIAYGTGAWTFGTTSTDVSGGHRINAGSTAGYAAVTIQKTTGGDTSSLYYMTFQTDTATQGYIWNNAAGNLEVLTASDRCLKTNFRPLQSGLANVLRLKPTMYDWKEDGKPVDCVGFIAQEMEEVFPRSVNTNAETGLKSIGFGPEFHANTIKAIQELAAQKDELRAKIAELEERIAA